MGEREGALRGCEGSAISLLEIVVAVNPVGVVGALRQPAPAAITSMPLTSALSVTVVNLITYWPLASAATSNSLITALLAAPAAAKISKLASTCVPLIETLNTREPAVVWNVSAKGTRTRLLDPAAKPGID